MLKITNSPKTTSLHKNTNLIYMQKICMFIHLILTGQIQAGQVPGQRDRVCPGTDFKGFFTRDNRDITASVGSGTQPPLPPLGGRGLSHPSRLDFYSLNIHMQCL